jgi:Domain of unknown function (DUF4340)
VSGKKTLVWAIILLALAAFYYTYEIQGGQKRQEAASKRELLFHFAADEVTGFTVKREQETVRAEKRDGHWYLTEPLTVRGDDQKYNELTRYVADLHHTRVVEEQPQSLEPYGLATPLLEIQVTLKDQSKPLILRLGTTNPTGGSYYAQVEGRVPIYLVSGVAKDVLDASLHALRDKIVLAFTPAEVQEIQLARGTDAPVVVQRQAEDTWRLTAPVSAKADAQQVRAMIQRLHDVKVQAFIAEDAVDLESYGLQTPAWHVSLNIGQDHVPLTLSLGKVDSERKGVYAKRDDDAARVFLLPQDLWDNLPKTATALRDKTLMKYEREHITRLEIQAPNEHMVITSIGPRQYTMEQPVQTPGDGDAIYSLLWDIQDLKAKDFVAETPDALDLYGLDAPRQRITVWEKAPAAQEATQHELLLGAEAPDGQGIYARLGEGPVIYLVGNTEAQRIMSKTAFDLRNKKIFAFTADKVQKIHVQYPAANFTVERHGNTWKLTEPQKQDIPQRWKVDHVLYELSTLEYAKIVADSPDDRSRYGLDTPQVQITMWQQDGSTLGPLVVGTTTDTVVPGAKMVYAQAGPHTPLYALKADFLNGLPKTPNELTATK